MPAQDGTRRVATIVPVIGIIERDSLFWGLSKENEIDTLPHTNPDCAIGIKFRNLVRVKALQGCDHMGLGDVSKLPLAMGVSNWSNGSCR